MCDKEERVFIGSLQKFSVEDGPGIRTTVFMKGCPLKCRWCHNPELIEPGQQLMQSPNNCIGCGYCIEICPSRAISMDKGRLVLNREKCTVCLKCADACYARSLRAVSKSMTIDEILFIAEQDKGFYQKTGGGITLSGGEILMHASFVKKTIDEAEKKGIQVCIDTSGFGNADDLKEIALKENVTHILYDMKSIDNDIHKMYTGVSNERIIGNLRMLAANTYTRDKIIMRMPLVKNINDSEEIIQATGKLYRELGLTQVHLLPYHNLGMSKQRNIGGIQEEFEAPDEERLCQIQKYFEEEISMKVDVLGRV